MGKVPLKKVEDAKRLRYIRALERFVRGVGGYLNRSENLSYGAFKEKVKSSSEKLEKAQSVELYKNDMIELEKLATYIQRTTLTDVAEIKEDILYKINKWEQSKNRSKYKKDKHKRGFLDGYE